MIGKKYDGIIRSLDWRVFYETPRNHDGWENA